MALSITFLPFEQVVVIHDDQIERYGGSHGIRDLALLESAVLRPQASFGGKDLHFSVFSKAAAFAYSLIRNHPFVDGNKRTAMVGMVVFLELNGYELRVSQDDLFTVTKEVVAKKVKRKEFVGWVKKNCRTINR